MVGRLSWMRVIGVATGFSLVVGLSVLPGTEAMAAAEESSPSPSLLLDPDRPAPALETPDFEVPATEFPEGEFDAAAPVAAAEPGDLENLLLLQRVVTVLVHSREDVHKQFVLNHIL